MFKMELSISMDKDSIEPSQVVAEADNILALKGKRNELILECCRRNRLRTGKGIVLQVMYEFEHVLSRDRLHVEVSDDYKNIEVT